MKRGLDIDGWVLQLPQHSDAAAEMIHDFEVKTSTLELLCSSHEKCCATFPDDTKYIGTPLPVLIMQIKNLNKFFSFDIVVEDTSGQVRTITASNKDNLIRFDSAHGRLPLRLVSGWNSVVLDLGALTRRLFNAEYKHATRCVMADVLHCMKVLFSSPSLVSFITSLCHCAAPVINPCSVHLHANCRVLRIFFADRVYKEKELPRALRIFDE